MNKTNNSNRARKAKTQRIRLIAGLCCIVVLLVACGMIGYNIYRTHERLKMVSGLQHMYQGGVTTTATAESTEPTPTPADAPANPQASNAPANPQTSGEPADAAEATAEPTAELTTAPAFDADGNPIAHADFAPLMEINEHLVGWLDVADVISLPVVHHDNTYYLDHDFYGNWDNAGTVFINEVNTVWPADKHLLLHGHNMRDGSAFGRLKEKYSDLEFLKANPLVYFRLINEADPTAYVPVAIFEASVSTGESSYYDIGNVFFDSDEDFVSYAQTAVDRSQYVLPFDVQADDHLISLITCSYGYNNGRFIVMCRELREGETEEAVSELMQTAAKK